ncbi:MAG TPA: hypothetical protein VFM58_21325 [Solirubrobacteraceae bacterium]|jgi:hypothetical protein|nr:hypothetical protein [Solirubrobacteraceae bacterium]
MPPNRIVALATPLVAPLAAAFAAWLSQNVPGVDIPADAMEEIFFAVLGVIAALALQFNHNRFKWDAAEQAATTTADTTEPDDFEIDDDDDPVADDDAGSDDGFEDDLDLELDDIDDDVSTPVR